MARSTTCKWSDVITSTLLAGTAALLGLGALEACALRRARRALRYRIHVNGTRGKSSVTRLIAAGLRAGGIRTCAKITGTNARMILPDGSEFPVYRLSRPNVIEQVRMIRVAAAEGAEALVLECMALQPHLQALTELDMLQATHGVITNARPDHLDVMGPDARAVAHALAGTTPLAGRLYTCEEQHRDVLVAAARDRGAELIALEAGAEPSAEEMAGFSYAEHPANVALALRLCADLGVERASALAAMHACEPDEGCSRHYQLDYFGRALTFVNGFAANDPESTEELWRDACRRYSEAERRLLVVNCRFDRGDRSRQLGEACVDWPATDDLIVIGSGTYLFARAATRAGVDPARLVLAEGLSANEVFELILERASREALVVGAGNVAGPGLPLVRLFRNRARLEAC